MPALGLALVASLALSAIGVASASALAPVNSTLPVVEASSPETGKAENTTPGTWGGSPTGYAYVWFRCNASGVECRSIPGATKSTYTPVEADLGMTLLTSVTASNSEGSGVALSKPTNVVKVPPPPVNYHWYGCQEVSAGTGNYSNSSCTGEPKAASNYEWIQLPAGTPTSFTSKNSLGSISLGYVSGGITYEIICSSASGSGTVLNPSGGGSGTLSGNSSMLTLTGCKFSTPTGCQLTGETITSSSVAGVINNLAVGLSSSEGSVLFSFNVYNCSFNGPQTVGGTLNGTMLNGLSALNFTKATSEAGLTHGGLPTWVKGYVFLTPAFGTNKALKLAP